MTTDSIQPKPHFLGHRERLRSRLLDASRGSLPDYEILEMLLFFSKPRGDMKPLAKELIATFGSFGKVLNADAETLKKVKGVGDATVASLRVVQEAVDRILREEVEEKPVLQHWKALLDYCRAMMGYQNIEQFRVLYLNKKFILIADEIQGVGTVDHTPVYPREVVKRALNLGATSLILTHNHPSGDPTPSAADIDMTYKVVEVCKPMGIAVHDHLIIAQHKHYSFKSHGVI